MRLSFIVPESGQPTFHVRWMDIGVLTTRNLPDSCP
jgi:hypothetical protein